MWPFDIFSSKKKYINQETIVYMTRYGKKISVPMGYRTDGATGAPDLCRKAWTVHDWICEQGIFDDGSPVTNLQASTIYYDILGEEGFHIRKYDRWLATYLCGGTNLRGSVAGWFKDLINIKHRR